MWTLGQLNSAGPDKKINTGENVGLKMKDQIAGWKLKETTALSHIFMIVVSAYRYTAITTLAIIEVSLEYLRQFLIDLYQTYRHSMIVVCHKTRLRAFFQIFSSSGFRARRRRDFFCPLVPVTV